IPGGSVPTWLSNSTSGSVGSLPVAALWLIGAIVLGWVVLNRTPFGIRLQALGGSEAASWSAGIRVTRVRILAYTASGLCSGLAAVVVGGTSLAGGVGTLSGSVLGAIALSLVSAVLLVSGLSTDYQYIVTGAIVIGALLAHSLQAKIRIPALARSRPGRAA